jgi:hypothetical protein
MAKENGEYYIKVQCPDPQTGEKADFIAGFENGRETRVSPLFTTLADLYPWMKRNGFKSDETVSLPEGRTQFRPWRVVRA